MPRTTLDTTDGKTTERKSMALRAYQRRTKQGYSTKCAAYLAETNTRRVRRALSAVFRDAGKDRVSRVWRKVVKRDAIGTPDPSAPLMCTAAESCRSPA